MQVCLTRLAEAARLYRTAEEAAYGDKVRKIEMVYKQHKQGLLTHTEYIATLQEVIDNG